MGNTQALCACNPAVGPAKLGLDGGEACVETTDQEEPAVMVSVPVPTVRVLNNDRATGGSFLPQDEIGRLVGDDLCAICLEPLRLRAQTIALCGHVFHRCCLNRCGDLLCPQCRQPIDELTGTRWGLFAVGTSVTICGLQNHVELNGTRCRVVEIHEASHRLEVRTSESGRLYRVRPENLVVGEGPTNEVNEPDVLGESPRSRQAPAAARGDLENLQPGVTVQLMGLSMVQYNGRMAVVLGIERSTARCEIRLGDGSVKTIRAENLRVVQPVQPAADNLPPRQNQEHPEDEDNARITL